MAENKWGSHCRYFTCMGGVFSCVIGGFAGKKQRMKFWLVMTPIFLLGRVKAWPLKSCMFPEVSQQKPLKNGPGPKRNFIFQPIDFPKAKHVSFREGGRLYKMIFPNPSQKWGNKTRGAYFCERFFAIFLAIFAMIATKTKFMTLSEGWKR